jgi:RNA polymerase sigma-70 factor (ECF subfamily)
LALRTLCQLSVPQIAAVLLSSEAAVSKRLTRVRNKIAVARIPYRVPSDAELPQRLPAVCAVVHTLYTAGHAPVEGGDLVDVDVCREALRLARLVHELLPDEALPTAVLALVLLTEARRPARTADNGEPILLPDQDRTLWDHDMVSEGAGLLSDSLRRTEGVADPYQLQAAIAAEHDGAASYAATDWPEVVRLYDLLVSVAPSGPAGLSRAVAVAERDGTEAGLAALEGLSDSPRVAAIRSELLARAGRFAEAAAAAEASLVGAANEREREFRERRLADWRAAAAAPD